RLARRLRPGPVVPALWSIGLASPLFFDAYTADAHTLGAALVAGSALATLRVLHGERHVLMSASAVVLAIAAGLLRNEALLFAAALGLVVLVVGVRRRVPWLIGTGFALGASAGVVRVAE